MPLDPWRSDMNSAEGGISRREFRAGLLLFTNERAGRVRPRQLAFKTERRGRLVVSGVSRALRLVQKLLPVGA